MGQEPLVLLARPCTKLFPTLDSDVSVPALGEPNVGFSNINSSILGLGFFV